MTLKIIYNFVNNFLYNKYFYLSKLLIICISEFIFSSYINWLKHNNFIQYFANKTGSLYLRSHSHQLSQTFLNKKKRSFIQQINSMSLVNTFYPIENYLKLLFIPMAILNMNYTVMVAFVVTIMAVLRVCKKPQFTKQYAQKVLLNNHGQNLMYIGLGAMGYVNFLYFAPLILFFAYGFSEFINQKYPTTKYSQKYMPYINLIRNNKFYIMEGKCKLQIVNFIFLLFSLPLDFLNRFLKVILLGQYLLMKFRISNEFKYAAGEINRFIDGKTKILGPVNTLYNKLINYVYQYATAMPQQQ